jgi:hypothetical protein
VKLVEFLKNIFKEQEEQQHWKLPFSEQLVLGCFFEAKFKSFAGCVTIRQQSSRNVKERQGTSIDAITLLTTLKTTYRFLKE